MPEERGAQWQLYPPHPKELYTYVVESICGATDDSQDVELYDGTLGVTTDFVAAHQSMVGQVQWNDNLAMSLGVRYSNFGNVSGVRWGSGTLVSDNLFLTAGHLFDQTVPPGSGWVLPGGGPTGANIISPQQIARNMHVNFNYQFDENGNLRQEQRFAIVELVEYRPGGLDIAVVRLAGTPRPAFGVGVIATGNPPVNDPICIIGHPLGVPKRIEAGSIAGYAGNTIQYNDIDTLGGNSGSPIWHSPSGTIVGVHTNGGCNDPSAGFFNRGVAIASALRVSPTVQSLTLHAPPILAEHSLKALDVVRLSRDNGASIEQWMYWGGPNQRFRPEPLGDGTFRFVADHSGKVLDIQRNSHANGAPLHQWEWHGGSNQRFRLEPVGRGYRRIVGQHSGKVVDVAHSSRDSGVEIHQWDWHGGPNQRFRLLTGPIFAQHSGKALDIIGFSSSDKAPLIQWAYHGDDNQIFRFEPLGDGSYRIVADHSGKVLDIEGFSQQNGARVIQFEWHGGPNQRFRVDAVGGGFYRLMAAHSGKVLDVSGISRENGAQIHQWDWHGGPNQRFRLFSAPLIALHSGRAMDVQNMSLDNKAAVVQWDLWGGQNQRFYPERLTDGTYRFVADHCRKVLDVEGSSRHNGARVIQFEWHGGPNQRFRLEPNVTAGEYRIVALHSGKVLDVQGISTANGANVHQWDWVGGFNQLWRFG